MISADRSLLSRSSGDAVFDELKRRWLSAGRPSNPDWGQLMDGL